jgi:enamine deaminase RidA (YjgF/YER057c/UK114 family)
MKNMLMLLLIASAAVSVTFGQTKMSNDEQVKAQIIALEKAGWEAWKNKDAAWFQTNMTEELVQVNSDGIFNKSQVVKATATDCDVKSYALDNFKFVMLGKDVALLTYTAMQDGVCSGKTIPPQVRATVNYVKRGGRWLEAMYMETPVSAPNSAMPNDKPETFSLRPALEKEYGYIHAMRIGDDLKISGAVSMDEKGNLVAPGNLEQQMKNCYSDLEKILKHYGYTFDDVTVENVFTTDMAGFIKVSGHRNSIYKNGFPTGTWLEVKGLALPGQLIEIDMEAHKAK